LMEVAGQSMLATISLMGFYVKLYQKEINHIMAVVLLRTRILTCC